MGITGSKVLISPNYEKKYFCHRKTFWKLDVWEDDSRRRRRFVQNPWGKRHMLSSIQEAISDQEKNVEEAEQEQFLKDLAHKMVIK